MKAVVILACVLLPTSPAMGKAALSVGYGEADITPPLGGSMPGYFRDRLSTGVLDPLRAKALVLTLGRDSLVILSLDLIGVQAPEVDRIRREIRRRTGIPANRILVHATHTHTGAMTPHRFTSDSDSLYPQLRPGEVNREWLAALPEKVSSAVGEAISRRVSETRTALGISREESIAFYRRYIMKQGNIRTNPGRGNPDIARAAGTIDPTVHVVSFQDAKVLLVSYGLHPDCIGGTQYSADYPYHMEQAIRERLGPEWRVVYLNAACGNINHIDVSNPDQRSGYEESRKIGRKLAGAALDAKSRAETLTVESLGAKSGIVRCPIRKVPPETARLAEQEINAGVDFRTRNFNELFSPGAFILSRTRDKSHEAEILALRIGGLGLIGLPAEVFVEIAREIKKDSPFQPTLVIGVTGGYMGYMPHAKGYEEGGYEAGYRSARYDPSTPALWIRTAVDLLRTLSRVR